MCVCVGGCLRARVVCFVLEEEAVKPLCDTLIMTCQTGCVAFFPNSPKRDTRV